MPHYINIVDFFKLNKKIKTPKIYSCHVTVVFIALVLQTWIQFPVKVVVRFSSNSEAFASELLENLEEMLTWPPCSRGSWDVSLWLQINRFSHLNFRSITMIQLGILNAFVNWFLLFHFYLLFSTHTWDFYCQILFRFWRICFSIWRKSEENIFLSWRW